MIYNLALVGHQMIDQLLDGRYQILEIIRSGEFGSTYLAKDTRRPGEPICFVKHLRFLVEDPQLFKNTYRRFQQEAEVLEKLSHHDQIPQLLAYFEQNQEFYLVESYINGQSLAQEILPGQPLSENSVIAIVSEVLEILNFVHDQGVIHRDIKPSNLLRRDADQKIMLLDFGAVKEIGFHQNNNPPTARIGTLEYMPIEQFECNPRLNSDIYALGMIAIQALTGMAAYELRKIRENHPTNAGELFWRDLAIVSPEFAEIIDRMVKPDYRERYQSSEVVLADINNLSNPSQTDANKLERYREEVKRIGNYEGEISVVGRQILEELRVSLQISEPQAKAMEDEILNPYRRDHQKGDRYQQALTEAIIQQYPLAKKTRAELDRLQKMLGISDQDMAIIEANILQYPLTRKTREELRRLQQLLGLSDDHVALIEAQILPESWLNQILSKLNPDRDRLLSWRWGFVISGIIIAIIGLGWGLYQYNNWIQSRAQADIKEQLDTEKIDYIQSLLAANNYQDCITAAQTFPESSPQYAVAQELLSQCQDVISWKQAKVNTFPIHTAAVQSVAVSPDGRIIASGSRDNTTRLWHIETGEVLQNFVGNSSAILSVDFSNDGLSLAAGTQLSQVIEWNLETIEWYPPLVGGSPIEAIQISPDNRAIATGSADGNVRVWNRRTGLILYNNNQHSTIVYSVAFTPNGRWLVTGSGDGNIHIIDWQIDQLRHRFPAHTGEVRSLAITPDALQIISGGTDNNIKIWNLRTAEEVITLTGHRGAVLCVAVSPDGTQIASSSRDRTVKIWNLKTGELLNTLTNPQAVVNSLVFGINSATLIGGTQDGTVVVWQR